MERKARNRKRTSGIDHLKAGMEVLGINGAELSRRLGMADNTVSAWLNKGFAPEWTVPAIDGLLSHVTTKSTAPDVVRLFLLRQEGRSMTVHPIGLTNAEATIGGRTYYLVPK